MYTGFMDTVSPHYNMGQYNTNSDITWSDLGPQFMHGIHDSAFSMK